MLGTRWDAGEVRSNIGEVDPETIDLLTALETMIIPEFLLPINIIY